MLGWIPLVVEQSVMIHPISLLVIDGPMLWLCYALSVLIMATVAVVVLTSNASKLKELLGKSADSPAPPPPRQVFQISRDGQVIGTYDLVAIRHLVKSGVILRNYDFWTEGMPSWQKVGTRTDWFPPEGWLGKEGWHGSRCTGARRHGRDKRFRRNRPTRGRAAVAAEQPYPRLRLRRCTDDWGRSSLPEAGGGLLEAHALGVLEDDNGLEDSPDPDENPEDEAAGDDCDELDDVSGGVACVEVVDADAEQDGEEKGGYEGFEEGGWDEGLRDRIRRIGMMGRNGRRGGWRYAGHLGGS
jgi:hypothetical protein